MFLIRLRLVERCCWRSRTAYYLVHLMSGSKDFERDDRQAASNFAGAAKQAGVRRIIYLGGLGDDADPKLSPHLRSRHEVGKIILDHKAGNPSIAGRRW